LCFANIYIYIVVNRCFTDFLGKPEMINKTVIGRISERDTFTFSSDESREWSLRLYDHLYQTCYTNEDAVEAILQVCTDKECYDYISTYKTVEILNANIEIIREIMKPVRMFEWNVFFIDLSDKRDMFSAISEGGHLLSTETNANIVFYKGVMKGHHALSIRGPDARKIAERYGGGGHECAAGFKLKPGELLLVVDSKEVAFLGNSVVPLCSIIPARKE
jgi:hypothetical protein